MNHHQSIPGLPQHPLPGQNGSPFFNYDLLQPTNSHLLHNSMNPHSASNNLPTSLPNSTSAASLNVNSIAAAATAAAQLALANNAALPGMAGNGLPGLPSLNSLNQYQQALLQNRLLAAGFPPMFPSPNSLNPPNCPPLHQSHGIANLPVDSSSMNHQASQNSNEVNQNGSLLATLQSLYAAQAALPVATTAAVANSLTSPTTTTTTKTTNFTNYHKEVNSMNNMNNLSSLNNLSNLNNRHPPENKPVVVKDEQPANHENHSTNRVSPVKLEECAEESNGGKSHRQTPPTTNGKCSPVNEHSKATESQPASSEQPKAPEANQTSSSNHLPASPKENSHP